MVTLGLSHTPHDTRYTTATLLDNAEANKVCIKNNGTCHSGHHGWCISKRICKILLMQWIW